MIASGKHKPVNPVDDADSDETSRPKKRGKKKLLLKKMKGTKTMKMSHQNLDSISNDFEVPLDKTVPMISVESNSVRKAKDFSIQEISPFEHIPTFKCQYCSKRSQV